ncbi:MAG: tRNA (N(6)-L-threonylcarbamoyladenosine(37)-C(2))-methylthiotransferase MtaB [Clostridia bacterium]|nr:tRNA (N(6)-L-threonylcarbamoyladenosine(37)-C(2))-methylthiotransferase MtaB [Clostridia bacterium]
MEKRKVAFLTLGCKVNQYETNGMIQSFQNNGYDICEFDSSADIYVINTCTVTNMSDRKSRQMLRQAKKNNKESIVVAVGCYVQVAKDEIEKIPEIDLVLGTNEKTNIVKYVEEYINEKEKLDKIDDVMQNKEYGDFGSVTYTEKTRAVIKVQDGCDRFCSYCIIPYARGRVRSRNPESVIKEIKEIALKGIKEVVITGIHVASYGKDFKEEYRLIDLLEEINKMDGIERIRLGSIEPLLITEEFINRLTKLDKICHHFHLSLQSGCTETLKRMNRRYTIKEFEEIVQRLRKNYNDVILTTDIIVGFPDESEAEFEETYNFLEKIKFYKMHVFKYSPRRGTKAEAMKNQIQGDVKEIRSKRLLELSDKNENEYLDTYIGKKVEVLFEEKDGDFYKGHTANYIMVKMKSEENFDNEIKEVEIIGKEDLTLIAK